MAEQSTEPTPILAMLQALRERGNLWVNETNLNRRMLQVLTARVRNVLGKIYGINSPYLAEFPMIPDTLPEAAVHETLTYRVVQLNRIIADLEVLVRNSVSPSRGRRIFIGHGRAPLWRELKDFIADRLGLPWEEFNREAVAGYTTSERLESMLAQAAFAFLIMTAEEEHRDANLYARPNVIPAILILTENCPKLPNFDDFHGYFILSKGCFSSFLELFPPSSRQNENC